MLVPRGKRCQFISMLCLYGTIIPFIVVVINNNISVKIIKDFCIKLSFFIVSYSLKFNNFGIGDSIYNPCNVYVFPHM